MADIAILGYGTVGSGVVSVIETNYKSVEKKAGQPLNVKYILDRRDFSDDLIQEKIVRDFEIILHDPDVKIVVEVMGGIEPAYTFVKRALLEGKSVVTSNKELVASYGAELLAIAKEKNINFLFEASVGGGIPIIRPLNHSLTADEIYEISGILNGTTNFILTKMKSGGSYEDALNLAQKNGYAERNPKADVEGHDTCRKIAILSSLAFGTQVDFENIYTEGITHITGEDFIYAKHLDSTIKLLAFSKKVDHEIFAKVAPVLIKNSHPMSIVNDVKNAIFIKGNVIGDVMFYGSGAGKLPTASAVVADIIDAIKHFNRNIISFWSTEKMSVLEIGNTPVKCLMRIGFYDREKAKESCRELLSGVEFVFAGELEGEFGIITKTMREKDIAVIIDELKSKNGISDVYGFIRIAELGD